MKIRIFNILILVSLQIILSCDNNDNLELQSDPITFQEIGKGALYGNSAEGISQSNMIITNAIDWQNLMIKMNSVNNVTDNFTETDIDFDNFMVIAIFLEVKGNGWEVKINKIMENETKIIVSTQETEYANTVMTQPFHIVKMWKSDKSILFE